MDTVLRPLLWPAVASRAQRWPRLAEFVAFGLLQARACVFAGSFLLLLAVSAWLPATWLPRYDALLIAALALQAGMVWSGLETRDELRAICLFHAIGLALEIFKTHPAIGSWSYPGPGWSKLFGVPLYSGFMYAAVASYVVQAWRLLGLRMERYPRHRTSLALAVAIYANFFTHHFIGDHRAWLFVALLVVFGRTRVHYRAWQRPRSMPLVLGFGLVGGFVWIAENLATYFGAWVYPHQAAGWRVVHPGKASSWMLLVVVTLIVVAGLKELRRARAVDRAAAAVGPAASLAALAPTARE